MTSAHVPGRPVLVLVVFPVLAGISATSSASGPTHWESYFLYNGAFPGDEETVYSGECSNNLQGITHDDDNWFFSMTEELWKIPVQCDLRNVNDSSQYPGVLHVYLSSIQPLAQLGYYHIGDMSYFEAGGQGYVLAAVEAHAPQPHAIVVFRADNLQYVCRAEIPGFSDLGWVAVDPDGVLHVSHDFDTSIKRFYADWSQLPVSLPVLEMPQVTLTREDGTPFNTGHAQGGVFSPSGEMFYFLSGIHDQHDPEEGISVFVVDNLSLTWRCVKRSHQGDDYQPFWYHIDPGSPDYEEPEGITIWDLDDGRAPGISGQLHVGMLDNDSWCDGGYYDDDDVTIYHYRNKIHVDWSYSGGEHTGEPHRPFTTVSAANDLAWDGARIEISAGSYPETLVFSKRLQVLSQGGIVRIGAP